MAISEQSGQIEYPSIEENPLGSSSTDSSFRISDFLLGYLSQAAKSALLSVSNLGASTTSKINTSLQLIDSLSWLETYLIDASTLNSLGVNAQSANIGASVGGSFAKIVIILGSITPTGSAPSVVVANETSAFRLPVTGLQSVKRLELSPVAVSFASNFRIVNETGVPFASFGNSVVVVSL